jgi:hypothetical protein
VYAIDSRGPYSSSTTSTRGFSATAAGDEEFSFDILSDIKGGVRLSTGAGGALEACAVFAPAKLLCQESVKDAARFLLCAATIPFCFRNILSHSSFSLSFSHACFRSGIKRKNKDKEE